HTWFSRDWSSDVCASDLAGETVEVGALLGQLGEGKGAAPAPKKEEPKKAEARAEVKKEEQKKQEAGPAKPADATPSPAVRRVARSEERRVGNGSGAPQTT